MKNILNKIKGVGTGYQNKEGGKRGREEEKQKGRNLSLHIINCSELLANEMIKLYNKE